MIRVGTVTKTLIKWYGRAEIMWNISYFKTFRQRQRLMRVNGLVSDKIYFEADTRLHWEPVKFCVKVFTAGVLRRTGD